MKKGETIIFNRGEIKDHKSVIAFDDTIDGIKTILIESEKGFTPIKEIKEKFGLEDGKKYISVKEKELT